jgi:hypothetical protein
MQLPKAASVIATSGASIIRYMMQLSILNIESHRIDNLRFFSRTKKYSTRTEATDIRFIKVRLELNSISLSI